ncbi:efflux RND transporter periplasmic adaptor subunit [Denitratisoma sp. DHT3]|uniref:efflux RND transporter periplasmic adaptor subunit n=1 Tax=Denitratisoma sp. DHT3 TaxID=1981880 RepID=UPI0016485AB0|nr:efflux RND transporter periplasmic adaptor subunit [Denitratisoma sp. DHT3]
MPRSLLVFLSALLPLSALAEEPLIALSPEQGQRAGIVVQPLKALRTADDHGLPAQVVIDPRRIEIIAAPLGGIVTAVRVLSGETVKKGQVLGRLQGAPLLGLQREYVEARGQAELAAEARRRDETLFAEGIIARARLQQAQAAERAAAALLHEKRQALALSGLARPDGGNGGEGGGAGGDFSGAVELRAPFAGVVLEAPAQPGQRLESSALLFKLGRLDALALEIQATPHLAAGVMPGDPVSVPGCAQPARVTAVAPQLAGGSQSVLVRAELKQAAGCVRPYQQLQVRLRPSASHHGKGWTLPTTALVRHLDKAWVFVAAPGGYRPVAVQLLDETDGTVRIDAALAADSLLVVKGAATVKAAWLGLGAAESR